MLSRVDIIAGVMKWGPFDDATASVKPLHYTTLPVVSVRPTLCTGCGEHAAVVAENQVGRYHCIGCPPPLKKESICFAPGTLGAVCIWAAAHGIATALAKELARVVGATAIGDDPEEQVLLLLRIPLSVAIELHHLGVTMISVSPYLDRGDNHCMVLVDAWDVDEWKVGRLNDLLRAQREPDVARLYAEISVGEPTKRQKLGGE